MRGGGRAVPVHPPPSPARTNFTLITEWTPESSGCNSVYSVLRTFLYDSPSPLILCCTNDNNSWLNSRWWLFKTGGTFLSWLSRLQCNQLRSDFRETQNRRAGSRDESKLFKCIRKENTYISSLFSYILWNNLLSFIKYSGQVSDGNSSVLLYSIKWQEWFTELSYSLTHTSSEEECLHLQNMEKQGEVTALDRDLSFFGSVSI